MRSTTDASQIAAPSHRLGYVATTLADEDSRQRWRSRALREAAMVRRVLRGAHDGHSCVAAEASTIDALELGTVDELLLTPRFIDLHGDSSRRAIELARAQGAGISTLSGSAAFELDLLADGVGAVLRRSSSTPAIAAQPA